MRSGGKAPCVLNLGTEVFGFMPLSFYFKGKSPDIHGVWSWVDPKPGGDAVGKTAISFIYQDSDPTQPVAWASYR